MFPDATLPCRLILVFVDTEAKIGNYNKNPYEFNRKWTYTVEEREPEIKSHSEQSFEDRMQKLEKQFELFSKQYARDIESDTDTQSTSNQSQSDESQINSQPIQPTNELISLEAKKRLRSFFNSRVQSESSQFDPTFSCENFERQSENPPTPAPSSRTRSQGSFTSDSFHTPNSSFGAKLKKTTKTVFIQKIEVLLNSTPIDQIEDNQTQDECIQSFWRMYAFNGQLNSLHTCGISYDEFRRGNYFAVYDLSTSGRCGSNYVVPSIRFLNKYRTFRVNS